jgi:hypothetical protein
MPRQFEIVFDKSGVAFTAEFLEEPAPITCENFWNALAQPVHEQLHHGAECGPEIWCYVPPPAEPIPYENSTVFPEHGDILYYHFIQPPTRAGKMVYDIGIYWDRGQSKLHHGWIAGNLFARIQGREQIQLLRKEAGRLLLEETGTVTLRRKV